MRITSLLAIGVVLGFNQAEVAAQTADNAPTTTGETLWFGIEAAPLIDPLVTDRPDFTESAITVPKGHLQIEAGFTYTDLDDGSGDLWTLPETLLRLGLTHDLELRLGVPNYNNLSNGVDEDGFDDLLIGAKWKFVDQYGMTPDMAIIPFFTLPTGEHPFGGDDVEVGATLAMGWDFDNDLSLGINVGLETFERSDGDDSVATTTSFALGIPLTADWSAFAEYFVIYPGNFDDSEHYLDGGLNYLINMNLQLDARIGLGLNDDAAEFFVGAGVSYRY